MGVKVDAFIKGDVYIDYPYEDVMFRFEKKTRKIFRKFHGKLESEIASDSTLYHEAKVAGTQVEKEFYLKH